MVCRRSVGTCICSLALFLLCIATSAPAQQRITPEAALTYAGQAATVCGMVAKARYAMKSKGAPTFLDFGPPYPQQVFTAVIWGRWRSRFSYPPESLQGREVCISGTITTYKGRAQIEVVGPAQIEITPQ
jgi:hypothetical protein